MLSLQGPYSRDILSQLTPSPLDNESFPFNTNQMITVAGHKVRALRVSFVGEMGWELHIPRDSCVPVYQALHQVSAVKIFQFLTKIFQISPGGPTLRPGQCWLPSHGQSVHREGLPPLAPGDQGRRQPPGGRPHVHLQAQDQHRLPGPGGAGGEEVGGSQEEESLLHCGLVSINHQPGPAMTGPHLQGGDLPGGAGGHTEGRGVRGPRQAGRHRVLHRQGDCIWLRGTPEVAHHTIFIEE